MDPQTKFSNNLVNIKKQFEQRCNNHLQKTIETCDYSVARDPQYVCEFAKDIMKHMMDTECNN